MRERHFFSVVVGVFVLFWIVPIVWMLVHFSGDVEIFNKAFKRGLWHSLLLGVVVSSMTSVLGVLLGVIFSKTDVFASRVALFLLILPLLIPPYILAFSWYGLFGHQAWLFGFWGCVGVLFTIYLPIPLLFTHFFLGGIDASLEESARLIGGWRGVLRIDFGLLLPVFFASFVLVFILVFGAYDVPNFLRYDLFSTVSFREFSAFYDFNSATASLLPLLLLIPLSWGLSTWQKSHPNVTFKNAKKSDKIALGSYQLWVNLFVWVLVGLIMIVPLLYLFVSIESVENLSRAFYQALMPLSHTLFYAFFTASLMMIFGFLLAYVMVYHVIQGAWLIEMSAFLLFALPATFLGISFILFYNHSWSDLLYASPMIVVLAIVGKYLFLSLKISELSLKSIPLSYLEAGKLLGARWGERMFHILLPLLKKSLLFSWLVGIVFALRESTLSMLLYPAGWESMPIYIFTQMANGNPSLIAAYSLIMIGLMALLLGILRIVFRSLS